MAREDFQLGSLGFSGRTAKTTSMAAKLEALPEAEQDTVLNYVNSEMKINDAYQRTVPGKPEQQQQLEPDTATPTA